LLGCCDTNRSIDSDTIPTGCFQHDKTHLASLRVTNAKSCSAIVEVTASKTEAKGQRLRRFFAAVLLLRLRFAEIGCEAVFFLRLRFDA